jgi:hypothetical protein
LGRQIGLRGGRRRSGGGLQGLVTGHTADDQYGRDNDWKNNRLARRRRFRRARDPCGSFVTNGLAHFLAINSVTLICFVYL